MFATQERGGRGHDRSGAELRSVGRADSDDDVLADRTRVAINRGRHRGVEQSGSSSGS
jgi:hypothetical protein